MIHQFRNRNFYLILAADVVLFALSLTMSYAGRFGFEVTPRVLADLGRVLPWILGVKVIVFSVMGAYRGMWRYTSLHDAYELFKASTMASLLIVAGFTYINRFSGYPRSVFLTDFVCTCFLCGGLRVGIRMWCQKRGLSYQASDFPTHHTRLLVVGAGDAADKIIREVQNNRLLPYEVVCCLDDDAAKHGRSLLGVPVRGPVEQLPRIMEQFRADEVLIAIPSARGEQMRRLVDLCKETGARYRTLPPLSGLVDGRVSVSDLREVDFEDLLGRPPVRLNMEEIGRYVEGKSVLVTGAGGSIGSELCRQLIRFGPSSLVLVDASEFNLYSIEAELRGERRYERVYPVLGRVQDKLLMRRVFSHFRPRVVFHAAACKHVPMVEINPWEAVTNNILGSETAMEMAAQVEAERFVLISTDKAVRPTNVMGASKRMAEILLQSRPAGKTRFMAVRFGNVVGSSGSVIPVFQRQIRSGGPITVTHPEITRYFMTIPEACQLVLQAGSMGQGGEIFVLEMGTPVKIADMARDLIRLSGKEPDRDVKIVYSGLRPGEKLYEELITHGEGIVPTDHEKIMVLKRDDDPSHVSAQYQAAQQTLVHLRKHGETFDAKGIKQILQELIPDYKPSEAVTVI